MSLLLYIFIYRWKGKVSMEEDYKLNKAYFDGLLDMFGRTTVGKIMKRFEITSNPSDTKLLVKETIYEEIRAFKQLLDAHAAGREQVSWQFKHKKGMED